jgi:hypothetical protein
VGNAYGIHTVLSPLRGIATLRRMDRLLGQHGTLAQLEVCRSVEVLGDRYAHAHGPGLPVVFVVQGVEWNIRACTHLSGGCETVYGITDVWRRGKSLPGLNRIAKGFQTLGKAMGSWAPYLTRLCSV